MKLLYLLLLTLFIPTGLLQSQNFVVSASQPPKCFGECNGTITFTTNAVTGPFTASLTNNGGCPNSTVQVSNVNSITLNSICACPGNYTATIYNPSLAVVGTMVFQFLNYATSSLVVTTSSITPATCSNCCDGDVYFSVTGGNQQSAPTYSIDGVYNASVNPTYYLCVGTHTVCVKDPSGCIACHVFSMPYSGGPTGLNQISGSAAGINVFPNPASNELFIESSSGLPLSKAEVIDLTGRKLLSAETRENKLKLNLSQLNGGLYSVIVYNEHGQAFYHKRVAVNR